jgi:hypothetical protein
MPTTESGKRRASSINPDPSGQSWRGTDTGPRQVVVAELTTVVQSKTGDEIYIGWGPDGNAAVTKNRRELSAAGQDVLRVYDRARNLRILGIPYADIVPVEYSYIKLKDLDSPAEDYFFVNTKDSKGQGQQYRIGELELLEGIVNASNYFQDTSATGETGQQIVPSEALYTVIAPCFEIDDKYTALAILFKPPMENVPQEATFQYFVVTVLRFLWQNDKKDDPQLRKGYYDAIQSYLSSNPSQVPLILRMAFTSEETAREKWEALRRLIYKQPEKSTKGSESDNLGQLDMEHLFSLATVMRDAARGYFEKNSPSRPGSRFDRR